MATVKAKKTAGAEKASKATTVKKPAAKSKAAKRIFIKRTPLIVKF